MIQSEGHKARSNLRVTARTVAVTALALCSFAATPATSFGAGATIKATASDRWSPSSKTVAKDSRVVWKNASDEEHNLVSYKGSWSKSEDLPEGEKTSYRFGKSGTYKFRCTLHSKLEGGKCSGMCGTVKVK